MAIAIPVPSTKPAAKARAKAVAPVLPLVTTPPVTGLAVLVSAPPKATRRSSASPLLLKTRAALNSLRAKAAKAKKEARAAFIASRAKIKLLTSDLRAVKRSAAASVVQALKLAHAYQIDIEKRHAAINKANTNFITIPVKEKTIVSRAKARKAPKDSVEALPPVTGWNVGTGVRRKTKGKAKTIKAAVIGASNTPVATVIPSVPTVKPKTKRRAKALLAVPQSPA